MRVNLLKDIPGISDIIKIYKKRIEKENKDPSMKKAVETSSFVKGLKEKKGKTYSKKSIQNIEEFLDK
jgi:hypothetical protein